MITAGCNSEHRYLDVCDLTVEMNSISCCFTTFSEFCGWFCVIILVWKLLVTAFVSDTLDTVHISAALLLLSVYELKSSQMGAVSHTHKWCTAVLIRTSRCGVVQRILVCTAILERDDRHRKSQNDLDTTGTIPAETDPDPAMQDETITTISPPAVPDRDQIHLTVPSDRTVAEGINHHMCMIHRYIQRTCRLSWSL